MPKPFPACDGDEPYVFVSYSHADEDRVLAEIRWLQDQGINVWYDQGISAGREWTDEIAHAIERCAAFVYFVSPASVESRHCRNEVQYAIEQSRELAVVHLIPTQMPSGLRLTLNLTQAILAHQISRSEARNRLLEAIRGETAGVPQSRPAATTSLPLLRLGGVLSIVALLAAASLFWLSGDDTSEGLKDYWAGQDFMRRWPTSANMTEARKHFENALADDPNNAMFHAALCRLELRESAIEGDSGALEAADRSCRTAARLDPESWQARGALAQLLIEERKHQAAGDEMSKALSLAPNQPELYETLGDLRAALEDDRGAIAAYRKAIELAPQYWSHYESLGSYLYATGKYADAVEPLETAVNLAPRDAVPVWNNLANAYLMSGRLDQAETIYKQTLQVQPTAHSHDALGRLYDAQGCRTHAADAFRVALEISESWRLWGALGEACMAVPGGTRLARLALQKALQGGNQATDQNSWRLAEVAFYYALLGEAELARRTIERIEFAGEAGSSATGYYLAEAFRSLGDRDSFDAARGAAIELGYPEDLILDWGAEREPCEKPAIEHACSSLNGLPI